MIQTLIFSILFMACKSDSSTKISELTDIDTIVVNTESAEVLSTTDKESTYSPTEKRNEEVNPKEVKEENMEKTNNEVNPKESGPDEKTAEKVEDIKIIEIEEKIETNSEKEIPEVDKENKESIIEIKVDHSIFDALLKKHVSSSGKVNYKALKSEVKLLDKYLEIIKTSEPTQAWAKKEKLAYWINVYNAFTLKMILEHYPVTSITSLHNGKPWDYKWIKIGNKTLSLNEIENDIIRPRFKEPRIHFAVNCAAVSCPPLSNMAYTAANLDKLLDSNTRKFVNNSKFNTLNENNIKISKIFEWYSADFGGTISFLNKYSKVVIDKNAKVQYNEYNWALNE